MGLVLLYQDVGLFNVYPVRTTITCERELHIILQDCTPFLINFHVLSVDPDFFLPSVQVAYHI
jgi:hypothetical protein